MPSPDVDPEALARLVAAYRARPSLRQLVADGWGKYEALRIVLKEAGELRRPGRPRRATWVQEPPSSNSRND